MNRAQPRTAARLLPVVAADRRAWPACAAAPAHASSHREAPSITTHAEGRRHRLLHVQQLRAGRLAGPGYVTLIANYLPLQDAYGGPNYFKLDPNALYEIHVDNNGDGKEDITFQFRFNNTLQRRRRCRSAAQNVAIPLTQSGQISAPERGDARTSTRPSRSTSCAATAAPARAARSPTPPAAATSSPSRSTTSARRRSRTTPPMRRSTSTPSTFPAARRRARSSSASARTRSPSTSASIFDLVNVPGAADFSAAEAGVPARQRRRRTPAPTTSPTRTSRRSRSRCRPAACSRPAPTTR